jgi:hypothetical protein
MEDLIKGRVYYTYCRNLDYCVWDGEGGFIGIREKFGDRFLDTEYHYVYSAHHGTVSYARDLGIDLPDDIPATESLGTQDSKSGRWLRYEEDPEYLKNPSIDKKRGWYVFIDTGERCPPYPEISQCRVGNDALFEFIQHISNSRRGEGDYERALQEMRDAWERYDAEMEKDVENSTNIIRGED